MEVTDLFRADSGLYDLICLLLEIYGRYQPHVAVHCRETTDRITLSLRKSP